MARTPSYTPEQDARILAARTRDEMEALSVVYGKPWRTLRERRRTLRSNAALGYGQQRDLSKFVSRDAAAARQTETGRPSWFEEDAAAMMKAGR